MATRAQKTGANPSYKFNQFFPNMETASPIKRPVFRNYLSAKFRCFTKNPGIFGIFGLRLQRISKSVPVFFRRGPSFAGRVRPITFNVSGGFMYFSNIRLTQLKTLCLPSFGSKRSSAAIIVFLFAAIFTVPVATAQTGLSGDLLETIKEQIAAQNAEVQPRMFEYRSEKRPVRRSAFLGAVKPLFIGVDDANLPAFFVDPADASATPVTLGQEVWGAAFDADNDRLLFNSGSVLFERTSDGTVTSLGTIVNGDGAAQSLVSLAWYDGVLYGTKNITTEAVYSIDTTTLVATIALTYPSTHDMGGLAVDPNTGLFYATDDSTASGARSLVRINTDGTVTAIAPYPAGETDLDALAIDTNGRAYLVPDQPGMIYVYDLVGGTYLTPFANPWTTSEVFSGAGWIPAAVEPSIVTVSGRAVTPSGAGIGNALISITDGASFNATVRTSSFGHFSFSEVPTGSYTITGAAKGQTFTPQEVVVSNADITDVVLTSGGKP